VASDWANAFAIGVPLAAAAEASSVVANETPIVINVAINNVRICFSWTMLSEKKG
jgi:hypothetical protein